MPFYCLLSQSEYQEDECDPHYGDQQNQQEADTMDLPEDLNLDDAQDEETKEQDTEQEQGETEEWHTTLTESRKVFVWAFELTLLP